MSRFVMIGLLATALTAGPSGCTHHEEQSPPPPVRLHVFCAAGIRLPMLQIQEAFEKAHPGVKVEMEFDGSGKLLGRLATLKHADYRPAVFVAGDKDYGDKAEAKGLVDRVETMAWFAPVIAVPKANPKGVETLADLARPDVTVALGEPRATAIGRVTDDLLARAGMMKVRENAVAGGTTVQELANLLLPGPTGATSADAAIIWDATAGQGDFAGKLAVKPIPGAPNIGIVICRVSGAPHRDLADQFIDMAESEVGRAAFRRYGFRTERATDGEAP